MSETERAWAAGFFDGEGHTGFSKKDKYIRIQVKQTGDDTIPPDVLTRFGAAIGVGYLHGPYPRQEGWKTAWAWDVSGYIPVKTALEVMWPYLSSVKKEQAIKALATCSKGGRKKTHCKYGHEFTEENTYIHSGWQHCLTCRANRQAARRAGGKERKPIIPDPYYDEKIERMRAIIGNRRLTTPESVAAGIGPVCAAK